MTALLSRSIRVAGAGLVLAGLTVASVPAPAEAQFRIIPDCRATPETKDQCTQFCSEDCRNAQNQAGCAAHCEALRKCHLGSCDLFIIITLIVNIYNYLLWLAAFIALLLVIWGGVRMFLVGFTETPDEDIVAAKNTVRRALAGLVIVLTAFLVVNTLLFFLGLDNTQAVGTVSWFLNFFGLST